MWRKGSVIPIQKLEDSSLSLSLPFVPALYWYCPGYFICLFIFEVSSTRSYFISQLIFQPLNMVQNQIKPQIILFWTLCVMCNCNSDRGKNTLILSLLLWIHISSVKSECQSCITRSQIKKCIKLLDRIWHWFNKALGCVKKSHW